MKPFKIDFILTLAIVWMITMLEYKAEINPPKSCPLTCSCNSDFEKQILCEQGGLVDIPFYEMDKEIETLIITAPIKNENNLRLGRLFENFKNLKKIKINYSQIPFIADSNFWPGDNLKFIDLSHNRITLITENKFHGLKNLEHLDLSHNRLTVIPSGAFYFLSSLKKLNLAQNNFTKIVPRMFWNLHHLEHLDLSSNKLESIEPKDFSGVKTLKHLSLFNCSLKNISSSVFENFLNLEELILSHNQINHLDSFMFKKLTKLKTLLLNHNQLVIFHDNTFANLNLRYLDLSFNQLTKVSSFSFINSTIENLDLSFNNIQAFLPNFLTPLSDTLLSLNVSHNTKLTDPISSVINLIQPLKKIQYLSLSQLSLNESLDQFIFANCSDLIWLDLSCNYFSNITSNFLKPLNRLEFLNISFNRFHTLSENLFKKINSLTTLKVFAIHNNPWSCQRCHIFPLVNWLNTSPSSYFNICKQHIQKPNPNCVKCYSPSNLNGKEVHLIRDSDIAWCSTNEKVEVELTTDNYSFKLLFAIITIFFVIFLIVIILFFFHKFKRVYYTNEKDQEDSESQKNLPLTNLNQAST